MKDYRERLQKLEETFGLAEKKSKKKPYNSKSITTGDIGYNIKQFNKHMGTDFNNPSTAEAKAQKAAEQACAKVGTFAAASPDGGSSISMGAGDAAGDGGCCESLYLREDVASSMPVSILNRADILDVAKANITTNPTNPKLFKLGYIKEFSNEIPSSLRGGRGSAGMPKVRIFKCIEYSAVYTGIAWRKTDKTMAADSVIGTARHTGEKTGFGFSSGVDNILGTYKDGSEALQVYLDDTSKQKVKYLISIDDSDLMEIDKADLVKYLTPSAATAILAPAARKAVGTDLSGDEVYERPINRLKLANIYMIGNVGPSIM